MKTWKLHKERISHCINWIAFSIVHCNFIRQKNIPKSANRSTTLFLSFLFFLQLYSRVISPLCEELNSQSSTIILQFFQQQRSITDSHWTNKMHIENIFLLERSFKKWSRISLNPILLNNGLSPADLLRLKSPSWMWSDIIVCWSWSEGD